MSRRLGRFDCACSTRKEGTDYVYIGLYFQLPPMPCFWVGWGYVSRFSPTVQSCFQLSVTTVESALMKSIMWDQRGATWNLLLDARSTSSTKMSCASLQSVMPRRWYKFPAFLSLLALRSCDMQLDCFKFPPIQESIQLLRRRLSSLIYQIVYNSLALYHLVHSDTLSNA